MKTKKEAIEIVEILKKYYPDATCSLDFTTPYQMMVAVMLSAQCTDERVNKTTPSIFEKYNTPQDFIDIDINELEKSINELKNNGFQVVTTSLQTENNAFNMEYMKKAVIINYFYKYHKYC